MFHTTDMGEHLEAVLETADCKVLRMKDASGDRLMTICWTFDGGRIVQSGTHEQLMQQSGIYRRFIQSRELAVGWKFDIPCAHPHPISG